MATKKVTKKPVKKATKKATMKAGVKTKIKPKAKSISIKKPFSKTEIAQKIAEMAELSKKQAVTVIDVLTQIIQAHVAKKGPGVFVFPGMAKFHVVRKPATKARKGINPFTGEPTTFAAKPARNVVKIRALKKLKDSVK